MKKAVIVVGSHHSGKSKTIKKFFKPHVGISENQRLFSLGSDAGAAFSQSIEERRHNGHAMSQSLEEKGLDDVADFLKKYSHYSHLVLAARPTGEVPSLYNHLKIELQRLGFTVYTVQVVGGQPDSFYKDRAKEILEYLK